MERKRIANQSNEVSNIVRSEALHYLPAKSIARLKGVCRDWMLQVKTPIFAHKQSNKFRDLSGFFGTTRLGEPTFVSLDPIAYGIPDPSLSFLPEPVQVRAASSGLLCCRGRGDNGAYYICNPATKAWKKLPDPNLRHDYDPALVLIFEPSLLSFEAEFRLLCACPCAEFDQGYEFEIFDSRKWTWKVSGEIYLGDWKIFTMSGVYCHGMAYWLTSERGGIIGFDLETERTKFIHGYGTIGVVKGKLCSARVAQRALSLYTLSSAHANTMTIKSSVKGWKEIHRVELSSEVQLFTGSSYEDSFRHVLYVGDKFVLFLDVHSQLYAYDVEQMEFRHLLDDVSPDFKVVGYVNSLVEI